MAPALDHVLRHSAWATATLLEFCRELDPSALDAAAPGTYGTLYGTLQHIVGAEQWYLELLTGEVIGRPVRRTERRTLDDLVTIAEGTGARGIALAADDALRVITMSDGRNSTVGVVLAQLVHHGNEHRGQATTILGANGIEPPPLSAWEYGRATGISEAQDWR